VLGRDTLGPVAAVLARLAHDCVDSW